MGKALLSALFALLVTSPDEVRVNQYVKQESAVIQADQAKPPESGGFFGNALACYSFDNQSSMGTDDCGDLDLTASNGPTPRGGVPSKGINFRTSSGSSIGSTESALHSPSGSFTIMLWFQPDGYNSGAEIVEGDGFVLAYSTTTDKIWAGFNDGGGWNYTTPITVRRGDRHFVKFGIDVPGTTAYLTVPTSSDVTKTQSVTTGGGDLGLTFFRVGRGDSTGVDATIDNVLMLALSPTAVDETQIYNSGKGVRCSAVPAALAAEELGCWNLDESASPFADSGPYNYPLSQVASGYVAQSVGMVEESHSKSAAGFALVNSEYMSVSDNAILHTSSITMSFWFSVRETTGAAYGFLGKDDNALGRDFYIFWDAPSNTVKAEFRNSGGSVVTATSTAVSTWEKWHFAVAWFDGTTNLSHIDVDNGTYTGVSTALSGGRNNSSAPFYVSGRSYSGFQQYLNGAMDNVAIWNGIPGDGTVPTIADMWNSGAGRFIR